MHACSLKPPTPLQHHSQNQIQKKHSRVRSRKHVPCTVDLSGIWSLEYPRCNPGVCVSLQQDPKNINPAVCWGICWDAECRDWHSGGWSCSEMQQVILKLCAVRRWNVPHGKLSTSDMIDDLSVLCPEMSDLAWLLDYYLDPPDSVRLKDDIGQRCTAWSQDNQLPIESARACSGSSLSDEHWQKLCSGSLGSTTIPHLRFVRGVRVAMEAPLMFLQLLGNGNNILKSCSIHVPLNSICGTMTSNVLPLQQVFAYFRIP